MHPVQVIAVTGAKGGVGKSNVSVNLSIALAELGRRVVLLDADLGLANIDVLLGISAKNNISNVLNGEISLMDVMVNGPGGIRIIPAASGTQEMANLDPREHAGLIRAFSSIGDQLDVLVIDTAEILVVVTDEPTSITDAYALIKLLNRDHGAFRFRILANMVKTSQDGHQLFAKLTKVTDRFLDVALQYVGCIPTDDSVKRAVQRQRAVIEAYPRAKASLAFKSLAKKVDSWPLPTTPRGNLEFFVENLVLTAARG